MKTYLYIFTHKLDNLKYNIDTKFKLGKLINDKYF